jgi:hypothetical protein
MRESNRFYEALPKHKTELIDGQLYIAGSFSKSAMMLGYMVEKLGERYVVGTTFALRGSYDPAKNCLSDTTAHLSENKNAHSDNSMCSQDNPL